MQEFIARLKSWDIDSRDKVLVAFSGGLDSRCLLELLCEQGFEPAIAHCNFQLRGEASDEDEQFCADVAESKSLKFHLKRFDTDSFAKQNHLSIQMAARELRYSFFDGLVKEHKYKAVFTAHHADDQIETMLIKLSRGSALNAVAGIPDKRHYFYRPLIDIFRNNLEDYARKKELQWREDASNREDKYLRNAFRLKLIPTWQEIQADFKAKTLISAKLLKEQSQALESLLEEKLAEHIDLEDKQELLHFESLKDRPYFAQLLFHWLQNRGNWDWAAVQNLAFTKKGRYVECEEWILSREPHFLRLSLKQEVLKIDAEIQKQDDRFISKNLHLKLQKVEPTAVDYEAGPEDHFFDFEKLRFPLRIRNWQEGDRFQPLGMSGKKKVSDYLIDQKISIQEKARKMVLISGDDIIAILGERIDHRYRVQNSSKTIYFVRLSYTNITSWDYYPQFSLCFLAYSWLRPKF